MLTAASVAAMLILLPDELVLFGKTLLSSLLFASNITFWHQARGYFGAGPDQNPLLHVWSLSVEEQFYVLWPLLLVWSYRTRLRRHLPLAIATLLAGSFGAAIVTSHRDPNAAFFMLHTRAWELLAGAFLAAGGLRFVRSSDITKVSSIVGLALLVISLTAFGDAVPFPGWNAVIATLGTVLVLQAGELGSNPAGLILSTRAPVFVGKISYSLYLWHWPMLVFPRLFLNRELALDERLLLLAGAFGLSVLSWAFVEQPFRRRRANVGSIPASFLGAAASIILLGGVALSAWLGNGLLWRMPSNVRSVLVDAGAAGVPPSHVCLSDGLTTADLASDNCLIGARTARYHALIWGDSLSDALAPGLAHMAASHDMSIRVVAQGLCIPLPDLLTYGKNNIVDRACQARNRFIERALLGANKIDMVILHADWDYYRSGTIANVADPEGDRLNSRRRTTVVRAIAQFSGSRAFGKGNSHSDRGRHSAV